MRGVFEKLGNAPVWIGRFAVAGFGAAMFLFLVSACGEARSTAAGEDARYESATLQERDPRGFWCRTFGWGCPYIDPDEDEDEGPIEFHDFPRQPPALYLAESEEDAEPHYCLEAVDEFRRLGCMTRREAAHYYSDGARYWLLRGDSKLTADDPEMALAYWQHSIHWGRPFGAQAALMAQRRVQAHMLQCYHDEASLDRIAIGGEAQVTEPISLELRQKALKALGYYTWEPDGLYGPRTRHAVRGFQRELGFDETGTLSPVQTKLLVCHAAQTARDPEMQNALGIMYSAGLGVAQNTDLALEWFETAAMSEDGDSSFNLALIFGTGAVLGSYRLCGVVENPERADAYLREAAERGHETAIAWRENDEFNEFPTARQRWIAIANRLEEAAHDNGSEFYLDWLDRIRIHDLQDGCGGSDAEPPVLRYDPPRYRYGDADRGGDR